MKAAVCREFGKPLQIEEIEIADPGPGEIKVKLAACAICHSDIHYMEGAWGGDLPAVYGHEAAGVIESVGPGVTGLKRGDHVVVTLIRSCGHCHYCSQGLPVHCDTKFPLDTKSPLSAKDGSPIVHGLYTAAFAEYAFVTVGAKAAIEQAFTFIAKAGTLVVVGMPADDVTTSFAPTTFASAGRKMLGSKMGSARLPVDMPLLVSLYKQGRLKLDELIS